jgi:hypothetical protein
MIAVLGHSEGGSTIQAEAAELDENKPLRAESIE